MSHNEVMNIANEEVDYAISSIPDIAKLLRNPVVDRDHIGLQSESDFYLGAAWATANNFFTLDFNRKFRRAPDLEEISIMSTALYTRNAELRQAISSLGSIQ
jgi:hypothetical protein